MKMKLCGAIVTTLAISLAARVAADEPKPIERPYGDGELVRLTIEGRKAYLVRPTKGIDPGRRWIWVTPGYLALADDRA
jgi:hypothetical protein